jgi:hypothetical protein
VRGGLAVVSCLLAPLPKNEPLQMLLFFIYSKVSIFVFSI